MNQNELKEILDFDPNTGQFIWKINGRGNNKIGNIAGTLYNDGYIGITIKRKMYKAHRLAWLYMTGIFPIYGIDHINGIRNDNRWCNLRGASQGQNQQNRKKPITNKSGYMGVRWHKQSNKWIAYIGYKNKKIHLGYFDDPQIAYQAYLNAKQKYHTFNPTQR